MVWPSGPLQAYERPDGSRMTSRFIVPPTEGGWQVATFEWALERARWTDEHHHIEVNFVVEGELHVDCGDVHLIAGAGDSVSVPPGMRASYHAPVYARMIGCYGPNRGTRDAFGQMEEL